MLNMSGIPGNRNSTPDANSVLSTLRQTQRNLSPRTSADMSSLTGSAAISRNRPLSDVFAPHAHVAAGAESDSQDRLAQQWIADIDQYETTLEEMAAATQDQDFKDELSAIEQWFKVLSEAERTAALYALLQQTTQVQIRFFIQVLQQMGKNHPMSSVLSPANFEKDPMTNRLSDAMNKMNVDTTRNLAGRAPGAAPAAKRLSGLDSSIINAMFPDAAAAIATEKAKFTQQTGNPLSSNRNSTVADPRQSVPTPISEGVDIPGSPWKQHGADQGHASMAALSPMGQFVAPQSAGPRSPQPQITSSTLNVMDSSALDAPPVSPYALTGTNWASMMNTPMTSTFNMAHSNHAGMVANATAMKLAALSTVNNRFALDDARKYRRANDTSLDAKPSPTDITAPYNNSFVVVTDNGKVISDPTLVLPAHQQGAGVFSKSRSNSPSFARGLLGVASSQSPQMFGGLLDVRDGRDGHEGRDGRSDDLTRGRPTSQNRRGSSKPPEDPADLSLLQDIASWLRSQRLHKYTDNLKDLKWTDLIELDDAGLEKRGINALGARRKMLKAFEQVKVAKDEGRLG